MTSNHRRARSGLRAAALVGLALASLSACTATGATSPTTPPSSAPATSGSAATASPTPTAPALVSTPFAADCAALVDPATLESSFPGLTVADAPDPGTGVDAAADDDATATPLQQVADADGTLCAWTDAAGDEFTLGVAHYDDAGLTSLANELVASSNSVPTYGVEGYFQVDGGTGRADFFPLPYYVVLESTAFVEPGSAEPMAAQVVAALDATGTAG